MVRARRSSTVSSGSPPPNREQELSSMYDYLAKIILLGPSGSGKSCLLHRFVKDEWRVLSSQTIGVEFASKIVKVGTGARRKRIKLQLWDTAGTERFRSVSRSYYRGAAGAILVYDIASHASFRALPTFLHDARALASPHLTVILAGNKNDLAEGSRHQHRDSLIDAPIPGSAATSTSAPGEAPDAQQQQQQPQQRAPGLGTKSKATVAPEGRDVSADESSSWALAQDVKVAVEVSALSGDGVEELFSRLARMILTRIELGEIDPDDPQSGIQYGDAWGAGASDGASMKSGVSDGYSGSSWRRRGRGGTPAWMNGMRDFEQVFRLDQVRRKRSRCC